MSGRKAYIKCQLSSAMSYTTPQLSNLKQQPFYLFTVWTGLRGKAYQLGVEHPVPQWLFHMVRESVLSVGSLSSCSQLEGRLIFYDNMTGLRHALR